MIGSQSYWGSVLANASQLAHKANCQLPFSWYFGSTVEALENRKQINTLCQPIAYIGSNPQVHSDKWRFIQISLLKTYGFDRSKASNWIPMDGWAPNCRWEQRSEFSRTHPRSFAIAHGNAGDNEVYNVKGHKWPQGWSEAETMSGDYIRA